MRVMAASGDLEKGELIAGRYRIESTLGSGGMAVVYRAMDLATHRPVALKLMRRELNADRQAAARFAREGELLRTRLSHPSIVSAETYGELDNGALFMAMELLVGETLGQKLRREQTISLELCARVLVAVCAGLAVAHGEGVIHRDLKPDNIFLVSSDSSPELRVKILDFGISKIFGSERLTQTGQVIGTPRYMAPEQLRAEDLDERVDVYALGVIAYEALAGKSPFAHVSASEAIVAIVNGKAEPLRHARPDVPEEVERVVMRAFAKDKKSRFANVVDFANAFAGLAHDFPTWPKERSTALLGSMSSTLFHHPQLTSPETPAVRAPGQTVSERPRAMSVRDIPPTSLSSPMESPQPARASDLSAQQTTPKAYLAPRDRGEVTASEVSVANITGAPNSNAPSALLKASFLVAGMLAGSTAAYFAARAVFGEP